MNAPLLFNIAYTLIITAIVQFVFHSAIFSTVAAAVSFCTLALFQGAAIHNKIIDTELEEKL